MYRLTLERNAVVLTASATNSKCKADTFVCILEGKFELFATATISAAACGVKATTAPLMGGASLHIAGNMAASNGNYP